MRIYHAKGRTPLMQHRVIDREIGGAFEPGREKEAPWHGCCGVTTRGTDGNKLRRAVMQLGGRS